MADSKISALTAVTTPASTDQFAVNQSSTSKRVSLSQLRLSRNVKDYGATGDGTTDDTTAIQTCIDVGVGEVYFPPGTYISTLLTLPSSVELKGAGVNATIIKLKTTTNTALIQSTGFAGLTGGGTSGGTHSWSIEHLTLDGNKANNSTTGYGLRVYAFGFRLSHVRIRDCHNDGIYSEWGTAAGTTAPFDMMAHLEDVYIQDCDNDGFAWKGPHDTVFVGCMSFRNARYGFWAGLTNAGTACVFIGCHAYGATYLDWAFYLETTGNILIGCTGEGAGTDATTGGLVFIGANDNTVIGGDFFSAGAGSPANSIRGFVIGDGSHTNVAGTNIDTKVTSCNGGAYVFGSDAGSSIRGRVYQTSGSVYSGTLDASTEISLGVGGAGSYAGNRFASLGLYSGSNARMGTATLTAGKAQIYTSAITANSTIFVTPTAPGGDIGVLVAKNIGGTDRSAGNWFFVSSMQLDGSLLTTDTSSFNWLLIEAL